MAALKRPRWILTRSATPWGARAHQGKIGFSFPFRRLPLHFEMRRRLRGKEKSSRLKVLGCCTSRRNSGATNSYVYNPTGGGWTFSVSAGVQRNGSAWGAPKAPNGVQTAFLQDGQPGGPFPSRSMCRRVALITCPSKRRCALGEPAPRRCHSKSHWTALWWGAIRQPPRVFHSSPRLLSA